MKKKEHFYTVSGNAPTMENSLKIPQKTKKKKKK